MPALKHGIKYSEFWGLTAREVNLIEIAYNENIKEQMYLNDVSNWQLGQYVLLAVNEAIAKSMGKNLDIYPKKPEFGKDMIEETQDKEKQEELETMKFQDFFSHLGDYVKIKDKRS